MSGDVSEVMDEDNWYSLVSVLSAGTCTLMLGPTAVTGKLDGEHLPVHVAMAKYIKQRLPEELREQLGSRFERLDPWRPAALAQVVLREADPTQIKRWVDEFRTKFVPDEQPIRDLASLGFDLVLNTSPDTPVYDIFRQVKPGAQSAYYDRTGKNPGMLPDGSPDAPVIYLSSLELKDYFEGLGEANRVDLSGRRSRDSIWIGTRTQSRGCARKLHR